MTSLFTLPSRRRIRAACVAGLLAVIFLLALRPASAQQARQADGVQQLQQLAYDWLQPALASSLGNASTGPLRPEVVMGTLDPRLKLAACYRVEPYLPTGTRLWGRSRIGLRCLEGQVRWNVFLPITIKAWGPAWVLKRNVTAGEVLTEEDAALAEIDWAEQHASVLANPENWVGTQASYSLLAGQALRQNMVRQVPVFKPGAQVRVLSKGTGFQVTVIGQAMTHGIEGESVRVRLKGGRIVTGTVRNGQVEDVLL